MGLRPSFSTWHHARRTREAAAECATKYKRDLAAGEPVPPRAQPRFHQERAV